MVDSGQNTSKCDVGLRNGYGGLKMDENVRKHVKGLRMRSRGRVGLTVSDSC